MPAPGFFDFDNFDVEALLDQEPTLNPEEQEDQSSPPSFRLTVLPGGKGQSRRSNATDKGSILGENGVDTIPPASPPAPPLMVDIPTNLDSKGH
jgi:hypothetical protein